MSTKIEFSLKFVHDGEVSTSENHVVIPSIKSEVDGERRLAYELLVELQVATGRQDTPKHNETAHNWLDFPNQPSSIGEYFDIHNSQEIWRELANLVMGAELDFMTAKAFKFLEPPEEPDFDNDEAVNRLYYIHNRKMTLFHQAIYDLIKVQDLVNRLLFEGLGGDVVDTKSPNWEKQELSRGKIKAGLAAKVTTGMLSQAGHDSIERALAIPERSSSNAVCIAYRNRLTHHVKPSVDYSMFYSSLGSRFGQEIRDANGAVVCTQFLISAKPAVQYKFDGLYADFVNYLDAVVSMLEALSELSILRR